MRHYRTKKRLRQLSGREILSAAEFKEYVTLCTEKLPNRLQRKLARQTPEQFMLELRPWYRKIERAHLWLALILAPVALVFVDASLQRAHHPVRLPVIGWIGVHHTADPGECDYEC